MNDETKVREWVKDEMHRTLEKHSLYLEKKINGVDRKLDTHIGPATPHKKAPLTPKQLWALAVPPLYGLGAILFSGGMGWMYGVSGALLAGAGAVGVFIIGALVAVFG